MSSSSLGTATEYTINGVKIQFPCKAYPSQLTMMDKIIKCIEKKQNSLLESPTGSGKSIALLCASLAWLIAEKDRISAYQLELEKSFMESEDEVNSQCCKHQTPMKEEKIDNLPAVAEVKAEKDSAREVCVKQEVETPHRQTCEAKDAESEEQDIDSTSTQSSDDADFQVPQKRFRKPGNQSVPNAKRQRHSEDCSDDLEDPTMNDSISGKAAPKWTMEMKRKEKEGSCCKHSDKEKINNFKEEKEECGDETKTCFDDELASELPPQIFFGTRTHKQITQIVRELNKTKYNNSKMCILASREHACIHPLVSQSKNKQEDCRKLIEGRSCLFHSRVDKIRSHEDLEKHGLKRTWDIEDLVSIGTKIRACPYYITREIRRDADIIFCPYNYLIDPIIRSQMQIDLSRQIVILDEAHNIEDSCREAASWSVTTQQLEEAMADIDFFLTYNVFPEQYRALHSVCANLRKWIIDNSQHLTGSDYEKCSKVWDGDDMLKALHDLAFTPQTLPILAGHLRKITSVDNAQSKEQKFRRENRSIKATTASLFEGLFMVLSYMLKNNYGFIKDYRVAIIKKVDMSVPAVQTGGWRRKGVFEKKWVFSLNFWCLSPAVAFSEISLQSRSVILTSGTLSPMSTFSSELGTTFPIQLEANHVVGRSQVWVSSLSVGPSGSILNATYRYAETFSFQDELGNAIHNVCQVVPHGVLCFFPSYSMLDKLMKRWKQTGLWERLMQLKRTFYEPRRGDKADFNDTMDEFYAAIRASEEDDSESGNGGALFLAVYRGKVSEGLDFADNNARAVITVGIPFPNVKDTQVELKRKYNNQYYVAKGLLNGSEWYETQAYRALNQALGRCIRHKNDWGAILLIDERFGKSPKYRNGLSKWIRNKVVHHNNFQNVLTSLKQFAAARLENPSPDVTLCRTPCSSPSQTPVQTTGTSTGLHERKPNLESPDSVFSAPHRSQSFDKTPRKPTNWTESKQDPHSSTPIPNGPQLANTSLSVPSCVENTQSTPQLPLRVVQIGTTNVRPLVDPGREDTPNLLDTKGTHRDRRDSKEITEFPGWQKALKRPLFCTQENLGKKQDSFVVEETVENEAVGGAGTHHGVEKGDVVTPPGVDKKTVLNTDVKVVMVTDETPESPLLFVTPPTSFGGSDDVIDANERMGVDAGNMRTGDDKDNEVQDKVIEKKMSEVVAETARKGQIDVVKNVNPKEEIASRLPFDHCKTFKEIPVCTRTKDLLDIVDCEQDKNFSKPVTWNLRCSCCGATFLSDCVKPEEKQIVSESILGNILARLFFLNSNRRKKDVAINTVSTCDFTKVLGCCSAINHFKENQVKRDFKLNSIYVEEEARCYVPLACSRCESSRKSRSQVNVVGVRAMNCGKEIPAGSPLAWFVGEKVRLETSVMQDLSS